VLMVSTIRFRSFKTLDSRARRPYTVLIFLAAGIVLIATHPQAMLVVIAYGYLASGFIGLAISRLRRRGASSSQAAVESERPSVPDHRDSAAG
jgi:CDP-diacylglycerol---serine O-phosphatidyltransferase